MVKGAKVFSLEQLQMVQPNVDVSGLEELRLFLNDPEARRCG